MDNPLIGLVLFGVVFAGLVVLLQGATGKDRDFLGSGLWAHLLGSEKRDQDAIDRMHPPERHPARLMVIGAAMILGALSVAVMVSLLGS
jgi:hypothetical protein